MSPPSACDISEQLGAEQLRQDARRRQNRKRLKSICSPTLLRQILNPTGIEEYLKLSLHYPLRLSQT